MSLIVGICMLVASLFLLFVVRVAAQAKSTPVWAGEFMVEMFHVPAIVGLMTAGVLVLIMN